MSNKPLTRRVVNVTSKGTSPLLMNRFVEDTTTTKKTKNTYDDKEEAKSRLYADESGNPYQPGEHIERALQKAGGNFIYKKRKTYIDYLKAGVFVTPDAIPHKIADWEIDRRPVVIQKSRIMRARPKFPEWELDFQIEIIDPNIEPAQLKEILDYAGMYIGIGDYRPKFGRFMVTKFEEEPTT